VLMVDKSPFG